MSTDQRDEKSAQASAAAVANPGRRRFAQAGLGASAVLGVLHARPVLASDTSIYHCTVSGHVSGNMSRPEGLVDCSTLGRSPEDWFAESTWPDPGNRDEIFNAAMGGGSYFFLSKNPKSQNDPSSAESTEDGTADEDGDTGKGKGGMKKPGAADPAALDPSSIEANAASEPKVQTEPTKWPATMEHVLGPANDGSTQDLVLGKVAAASLLSARAGAVGDHRFPLTPAGVQHMFRSVYGSGAGYAAQSGTNTVIWDRAKVIWWLQSLYDVS